MAQVLLGTYTYAEFLACAVTFVPIMGVSHFRHRKDPTQRMSHGRNESRNGSAVDSWLLTTT